ncbi:MAG: hypothetical protein ACFE9N_00590 [Promethearchaeota archaeon]
MKTNQIFNLEKIKELTYPIEDLQIKLNQLKEISLNFEKNSHIVENQIKNETFLAQIATIKSIMQNVNNRLNKITKINLNKFLDFQDKLVKKYKEIFRDKLKNLKIDKDLAKRIGLSLIQDKKISKIIDFVSFIPSIEIQEWLELLDSLKYNSLFQKSVGKIRIYYQELLQKRLENELDKIPEETNPILIEEYKKFFIKNPDSSFKEYLKTSENRATQKELTAKREILKKVREKEELEKLKKKQKEQKETYEEYLKLSDREFERLRRRKSREKLTDISKKATEQESIEISDEVSEKIKKFKLQMNKSFNEKYMIQKDEDKDPIDLIRERKKKKEKEYKEYRDHFNNQ